jgi:hypothetical protein
METAFKIKPQEGETTRHHDTRVASGELLRLIYNTHRKYKRFSETIFHPLYPSAGLILIWFKNLNLNTISVKKVSFQ